MNILSRLLIVFSLFTGLTFGYNFVSTNDVPQRSTVLLTDGHGNGSGVLIGRRSVLTVAHVAAAGAMSVQIGDKLIPLKVASIDEANDLAVMTSDTDIPGKIAQIGSDVKFGDTVVAVGFPANYIIKEQITTEGKVQSNDQLKIKSTNNVIPGNSGGGLFHREWSGKYKVVGLTDALPVVPMGMFTVLFVTYIDYSVSTPLIKQFLKYGPLIHAVV